MGTLVPNFIPFYLSFYVKENLVMNTKENEESNIKKASQPLSTVKVKDRSRGRKEVTMKFSAEESQALNVFQQFLVESQMDPNEIFKLAFFKGLDQIHSELRQLAEDYAKHKLEEQKAQETQTTIVTGKHSMLVILLH